MNWNDCLKCKFIVKQWTCPTSMCTKGHSLEYCCKSCGASKTKIREDGTKEYGVLGLNKAPGEFNCEDYKEELKE